MNEFDYLAKAKDKMCDEKYNEVISLCTKALNINSELPDAYNFRGNAKYELEDYDSAVDDFNKAIEKEPKNSQHYYDRSWAYNMMGCMEDAILDINKAIELNPKEFYYYYDRARFKHDMKRLKEAVVDYTKGIEINPTKMQYIKRGNCYMQLNKYDLAYADFTSAIDIEPKSALAYHRRGILKTKLEQYKEAIEDFEKSIEIYPESAASYIEIGYAKIHLGKKDAMKHFNKAIKINPCADNYFDRIKARGEILFREYALKNLAQNKEITRIYGERTLYNVKQAKDDIKDLDKALKDEPENTELLEYRADRYYYLGEYDKSIADCTSLIELDPDNYIYYSVRAAAEQCTGKYQETIDDCNKCIEIKGNEVDTDLLFLKSNAEYKLEQYEKVITDLNVALAFEESCGAYYYRGLAHYQLSHHKQAVSDIQKAIELKSNVLEIYDDELPKPFADTIKALDAKEEVVRTEEKDSSYEHIKQKTKSELPIGIAGLRKLLG